MLICLEHVDLKQINNIIDKFIHKNREKNTDQHRNEDVFYEDYVDEHGVYDDDAIEEAWNESKNKIIQRENRKYKYQRDKLCIKLNREFIYGIILFIDFMSETNVKRTLSKEDNYSDEKEYYYYYDNIIASINGLQLNYLKIEYNQSVSYYDDADISNMYNLHYQNNLPMLNMLFNYKNYTYDENKNKSLIYFSEKEANRNRKYRKILQKDIDIIHKNRTLFYAINTMSIKKAITKRIYDGIIFANTIYAFMWSNIIKHDIKNLKNNNPKVNINRRIQNVITVPFDKNNQLYLPNIDNIKTVKVKLPPNDYTLKFIKNKIIFIKNRNKIIKIVYTLFTKFNLIKHENIINKILSYN